MIMKSIEQLEQEAKQAREYAIAANETGAISTREQVDSIILASVAMMTYQLALADLASRKE